MPGARRQTDGGAGGAVAALAFVVDLEATAGRDSILHLGGGDLGEGDLGAAIPGRVVLASVLANEFTEATTDTYLGALFEIGLVLFGITILVNLLAQLLLRTIATTSATRAVQ